MGLNSLVSAAKTVVLRIVLDVGILKIVEDATVNVLIAPFIAPEIVVRVAEISARVMKEPGIKNYKAWALTTFRQQFSPYLSFPK